MTQDRAETPLVSIVTAYHNRADAVEASVRSLLDQTYGRIEIVIVDDGSTDSTLDRLKRFEDPRIRLIAQPNAGFTKAIRAAIEASQGSLVAVHGSGDISLPERIRRQVEAMARHPEAAVVGCRMSNARVGRDGYFESGSPNGLPFVDSLLQRNLFAHGEVMFRRSAYDAVGGYRPFFRLAQDIDLWLRIGLAGGGYHIVEEILYKRELSANGVSTTPEKVLLQKRFSEFARQCAESARAGRGDLLDRYGAEAPFHMRRTERLALALIEAGSRLMVYGDPKRGWPLVDAGFAEMPGLRRGAIYAVMSSHRWPRFFGKVVAPAVRAVGGRNGAPAG